MLVDEAYFEYADEPGYATAVPLAVADRRVLVTRTFSKVFGMAGLRVGYAIAHPDTLAALEARGPDGTLSNASLGGGGRGVHRHGAHRRRVRAQPGRPAVHARALRGGRLPRAAVGRELRDGRHQARRRLVRLGMPPAADRGGASVPAARHLHAADHRHAGRDGRSGAGDPGAAAVAAAGVGRELAPASRSTGSPATSTG